MAFLERLASQGGHSKGVPLYNQCSYYKMNHTVMDISDNHILIHTSLNVPHNRDQLRHVRFLCL